MSPSKRNFLLDLLFTTFVGGLLVFCFSSGILSSSFYRELPLRLVLPSFLVVAAWRLCLHNWKTFLVGSGAFALCAGLLALYFFLAEAHPPWVATIVSLVEDVLFLVDTPATRDCIGMLFICLLAPFVVLNLHSLPNIIVVTLVGTVIFAIPLGFGYAASLRDFYLFIFLFLTLFIKRLNGFVATGSGSITERTKRQNLNPLFSLFAVVLAAVLTAGGVLLPKPDFSADALLAKTAEQVTKEVAATLQEDRVLLFSEGEQELGGPMQMDNTVVMEVDSDIPVYLSAAVRDTYTGRTWLLSDKAVLPLEAHYSPVYPEAMQEQHTYYSLYYAMPQKQITVRMVNNYTRHVFTPSFYNELFFPSEVEIIADYTGQLSSKNVLSSNQLYSVSYYSWQYDNPYLIAILQENGTKQPSAEEMERFRLDSFLTVPDTLPARVGDLASEITAEYTTNYEKLKAIEAYLQQFPYTLRPDPVPKDEDFIDYFLFEGKEGYCTYYASSMAIMARTLGIPTRYVEGYASPPDSILRDGKSVYQITNRQAHAWVEAYFPAFGWVPFEPTSSYSLEGDMTPLPDEQSTPDPVSEPPKTPETPEVSAPDTESSTPAPLEPSNIPFIVTAVLGVLLLAGGILLLFLRLRRRYHAEQQRRNDLAPRAGVVRYYELLAHLLALHGISPQQGETPLTFGQRAEQQLPAGLVLPLASVAQVYSQALYSEEPVSPSGKLLVQETYEQALAHKRTGVRLRLSYLLHRYGTLRL